jgi:hypothetical protein
LASQAKRRKENYDQRMNLAIQLEKFRNSIDAKEKQCNEIIKESELEQQRRKIEQENKNRMDQQLKEYNTVIRRHNEAFLAKEREVNNALKAVRRAKFALEAAKKSIPELQNKIAEMQREVEKEEAITKKQHATVSYLVIFS